MRSASVCSVSPSSRLSRVTWVSTGRPGQVEGDAAHHVGGLAAHPGQGHQVLDGRRDLTAEALVEGPAQPDQAPGLGAEEPGGVDQLLQLRRLGGAEDRPASGSGRRPPG